MTNGDKIRAMEDIELANFLFEFSQCAADGNCGGCPFKCVTMSGFGCNKYSFEEWLDMEVDTEEDSKVLKSKDEPAKAIAAIDASAKQGKWIDPENDDGKTEWHCSKCGKPIYTIGGYPVYSYCPHCGAAMKKEVRARTTEHGEKHDDCDQIIQLRQSEVERFGLLAEEAAELSAAASKMRRILVGEVPTPVTREEALKSVIGEIADVKLCVDHLLDASDFEKIDAVYDYKRKRWIERIRAMKEKELLNATWTCEEDITMLEIKAICPAPPEMYVKADTDKGVENFPVVGLALVEEIVGGVKTTMVGPVILYKGVIILADELLNADYNVELEGGKT